MKKCAKLFLVMLGLLIGFTVNAHAVSAATLHYENSDYWYTRSKGDGSDTHSWYWRPYEMDGRVAYCIEPGTVEGTTYSHGTWEATGLSNSIKERVLLVGYYGYTYPGHQTEKYRMATQGMIWNAIIGEGTHTIFSTERWGAGTVIDISGEEAEIERLIAHHHDRPSFNGGVYR